MRLCGLFLKSVCLVRTLWPWTNFLPFLSFSFLSVNQTGSGSPQVSVSSMSQAKLFKSRHPVSSCFIPLYFPHTTEPLSSSGFFERHLQFSVHWQCGEDWQLWAPFLLKLWTPPTSLGFLWWFIQVPPLILETDFPGFYLLTFAIGTHFTCWVLVTDKIHQWQKKSCFPMSSLLGPCLYHEPFQSGSHPAIGCSCPLPANSPAFPTTFSVQPQLVPFPLLGSSFCNNPAFTMSLPCHTALAPLPPSWASPSAAATDWISTTKNLPHALKWSSPWTTASFPGQDFSLLFSGFP